MLVEASVTNFYTTDGDLTVGGDLNVSGAMGVSGGTSFSNITALDGATIGTAPGSTIVVDPTSVSFNNSVSNSLTTAITNTLIKELVPKAWATVLASPGPIIVIPGGANVSSVVFSSSKFTVTLASHMLSGYAVLVTSLDNQPIFYSVDYSTMTTSGGPGATFTIKAFTSAGDPLDISADTLYFSFVVFGAQ